MIPLILQCSFKSEIKNFDEIGKMCDWKEGNLG